MCTAKSNRLKHQPVSRLDNFTIIVTNFQEEKDSAETGKPRLKLSLLTTSYNNASITALTLLENTICHFIYICRLNYLQYIGGILAVTRDQFQKTNGFSNLYQNWGLEDDDFYRRYANLCMMMMY